VESPRLATEEERFVEATHPAAASQNADGERTTNQPDDAEDECTKECAAGNWIRWDSRSCYERYWRTLGKLAGRFQIIPFQLELPSVWKPLADLL
jgi:hypothetical protein